jgi:pimeloyl-ACP methyl ester carboxylesterase
MARDFTPGHRLVIVDLPGYGRSDPPSPARTSYGAHAAAVLALLDDLGIPHAVLVGHGVGGGVAQAFAIQWPARVSALALVSSSGFGLAPRGMARIARALGPLARFMPPALLASLVHGSVRKGFEDPERSRFTLDTCLRHFTTAAGRDALAAHLRALGDCDTKGWSRRLGEIQAPTAVIWGEDDPFYSIGLGERLAAAIPGATFEIVRGAAHFVPEDQPEQLRRALDLLIARASA